MGVIFLTCLFLMSVMMVVSAQTPKGESTNIQEQRDEHRSDLAAFRAKYAVEIAALPKITLKETSKQLYDDANKLAREGLEAFNSNSLEEAEVKLLASLSLWENDLVRKDYALVLVEEQKYLEALPSCVEAALCVHNEPSPNNEPRMPAEETPLPLPTLAYTLAQVGDLKMAANVYNFTRNKLAKDIKRNISMFSPKIKTDSMTVGGKLRLPLPPLTLDPEKTDRKALIENSRILFLIISELYFDKDVQSNNSSLHRMLPNRLAFKMIDEAYAANPESAILIFYKGYSEISREMPSQKTQELMLESIKKAQEWFLSATTKAGANSPLGKLSAEYIADTEKVAYLFGEADSGAKGSPVTPA